MLQCDWKLLENKQGIKRLSVIANDCWFVPKWTRSLVLKCCCCCYAMHTLSGRSCWCWWMNEWRNKRVTECSKIDEPEHLVSCWKRKLASLSSSSSSSQLLFLFWLWLSVNVVGGLQWTCLPTCMRMLTRDNRTTKRFSTHCSWHTFVSACVRNNSR